MWFQYISAGVKVYVYNGYNFTGGANAPSYTPVITSMLMIAVETNRYIILEILEVKKAL